MSIDLSNQEDNNIFGIHVEYDPDSDNGGNDGDDAKCQMGLKTGK